MREFRLFALLIAFSGLLLFSSCSSNKVRKSFFVQTFVFDSIDYRHGVFDFPDNGESYEKILMYYTLKCDDKTSHDKYACGEWDYLTYTNIHKDGEIFEIGRFITPYGKYLDLGPDGFTWIYDVSDYAPLLKGEVELSAGNRQELIDLKFEFYYGTPAREVLDVKNIWETGSYTYEDLADDKELKQVRLTLPENASEFKIRSRISGHGHFGPHNCCEWDAKKHYLRINSVERFEWTVWKDCGRNPVYPQGGTWQFDRAGWCPGTFVDTYDHELTPFVHPGEEITIEYTPEEYHPEIGEAGGNYVLAHQLISYGEANFENDAEIVQIIAPNIHSEFKRFNPISNQAIIRIRNRGKEPLTSLKIKYGLKSNFKTTIDWNGKLGFMEEADVVLYKPEYRNMKGGDLFVAEVFRPNGKSDEYSDNNHLSSVVPEPVVLPEEFIIHVETTGFGRAEDNAWIIYDQDHEILEKRTSFCDDSVYNDKVRLAPGSYEFYFYDFPEDGLIRHWWLRGSEPDRVGDNGRILFLSTEGDTLRDFGFDFAEEESLRFFVGEIK